MTFVELKLLQTGEATVKELGIVISKKSYNHISTVILNPNITDVDVWIVFFPNETVSDWELTDVVIYTKPKFRFKSRIFPFAETWVKIANGPYTPGAEGRVTEGKSTDVSTAASIFIFVTQFEDTVKPAGKFTQNTPAVTEVVGLKLNVSVANDPALLVESETGLLVQVSLLQVRVPGSVDPFELIVKENAPATSKIQRKFIIKNIWIYYLKIKMLVLKIRFFYYALDK